MVDLPLWLAAAEARIGERRLKKTKAERALAVFNDRLFKQALKNVHEPVPSEGKPTKKQWDTFAAMYEEAERLYQAVKVERR